MSSLVWNNSEGWFEVENAADLHERDSLALTVVPVAGRRFANGYE